MPLFNIINDFYVLIKLSRFVRCYCIDFIEPLRQNIALFVLILIRNRAVLVRASEVALFGTEGLLAPYLGAETVLMLLDD